MSEQHPQPDSPRFLLWKHLLDEHKLTLLDSEVEEIIRKATATIPYPAAQIWEQAFDAYCNGAGDKTAHERAAAVISIQLNAEMDRLNTKHVEEIDGERAFLRIKNRMLEELEAKLTALKTALTKEREEFVYFREEITFLATGVSELNERFKDDKQLVLVDGLRAELALLKDYAPLIGRDTPWPVDLLLKALVVAEAQLKRGGRDFDGWEAVQTAASIAQTRLAGLQPSQTEEKQHKTKDGTLVVIGMTVMCDGERVEVVSFQPE